MLGKIYCISNAVNGKRYIGQTIGYVRDRWTDHLTSECYLGRALRKYGSFNFVLATIDTADTLEKLNDLEVLYIKQFNTRAPFGYNLRDGGGNCGKHHPLSNLKNSLAHRGRPSKLRGRTLSDEHCLKLGFARRGCKHTLKTREHLREALSGSRNPMFGKKFSSEYCEKLSGSHKGQIPWNKGKRYA